MRSGSTLNVRVWRGAAAGNYQAFEVPRHASQTVLDVVTHIQRVLDPTLAYRFACRVGMCGSCAMTVNGVPRWTCRTHVDKALENGDEITIEPLRNLPVIKLSANPRTVRTMSEHIDVDVSGLLRREMSPDQAGDALLECMFRTANGRLTAAEALGHREFVLTRLYESA